MRRRHEERAGAFSPISWPLRPGKGLKAELPTNGQRLSSVTPTQWNRLWDRVWGASRLVHASTGTEAPVLRTRPGLTPYTSSSGCSSVSFYKILIINGTRKQSVSQSSVSHCSRLLNLRSMSWKPPIHSWLVKGQKAWNLQLTSGVGGRLVGQSPSPMGATLTP